MCAPGVKLNKGEMSQINSETMSQIKLGTESRIESETVTIAKMPMPITEIS